MRHAAPAAAALLLAACSLTAEIEVPHIGVTIPGQSFPASDTSNPLDWCDPLAPPPPIPCIARSIDYDLGAQVPALTNEAVSYDLRLTDVALHLSSAGDLSGVQSVVVRVFDLTGTSSTVVASYDRPVGGPASTTSIGIAGNANVDVGPYLDAGIMPVRVELVIDSPTPAFEADVQAGFSIVITVDWGQYL